MLSICTLTGADDSTELDSLWHLAEQFRFVEFGVLYDARQQGTGRYPSLKWIDRLVNRIRQEHQQLRGCLNAPRFSLHICGRGIGEFLSGKGHVSDISSAFDRIQLNFVWKKWDIALIRAAFVRNPHKKIITQHNEANAELQAYLTDMDNHVILFDESGGRGLSARTWPNPAEGSNHEPSRMCGYAGGLGPESLETELPKILLASAGRPFWIDMEGKLRDETDRFCLDRARRCLGIVSSFREWMKIENLLHPNVEHFGLLRTEISLRSIGASA